MQDLGSDVIIYEFVRFFLKDCFDLVDIQYQSFGLMGILSYLLSLWLSCQVDVY